MPATEFQQFLAGILAFGLVASTANAIAADEVVCSEGKASRLAVKRVWRPEDPRHDESIGGDTLILTAKDGKQIFREDMDDSHLECLGFSETSGQHLVGRHGERGAWMVLGSIFYLPETGGPLQESAFNRERFLALASLSSPKGRYIAFVGGHDSIEGLFVLDTQTDKIRRLGKEPAPPPDRELSCEERFGWGTCWADGYVTLEKSVLRFESEDVLVVTYGKDTGRRRATERTVRRFRL